MWVLCTRNTKKWVNFMKKMAFQWKVKTGKLFYLTWFIFSKLFIMAPWFSWVWILIPTALALRREYIQPVYCKFITCIKTLFIFMSITVWAVNLLACFGKWEGTGEPWGNPSWWSGNTTHVTLRENGINEWEIEQVCDNTKYINQSFLLTSLALMLYLF